MFCTQCGCIIDENMQYCPECGKKQFDLPVEEEKPYKYGLHLFVLAFAASFMIILALNVMGAGLFAFLFIPFIFLGRRKNKLQYIVSGVCWGFICGATTSIVLRVVGVF